MIESIAGKRLTADLFDYRAWRRSGAPEAALRDLFAYLDRKGREVVERKEHSVRVEDLEALYAVGAQVDPLIARPIEQLPMPLSSGEQAVFILDGRHRLFAAAAQDVDELDVYVVVEPLL